MDAVRSAKYILAAVVVLVGLMMGSCTDEVPEDVVLASAPAAGDEAREFTVSFKALGTEVARQTVSVGQFPQVPQVEAPEGSRLGGWVDLKGRRAQPAATPVKADCEYTAVFFPLLDGEGPYLFTDGEGLLHPDAILNGTELVAALNALASAPAREIFPDLSAAKDDITFSELRTVLGSFYTLDELDRVILGHNEAEKVSRSQFAEMMNALLGRDDSALVLPEERSYCIPDVSPDREDYKPLMEAAVAHGHSADGCPWTEVSLQPLYKEGYVLVEGNLYYADSKGFFLRDTVEGSLTFGYDGRYTSGDAALDGFVSAAIADISEVNSFSAPSELLIAAYDYCCSSFSVTQRNMYGVGVRGWEMAEALTMFEARSGNSYSYAAAFWALARGLGYEANAVNGPYGDDNMSHAWVEIEIDGENYIFDPAAEAGAFETSADVSMFMVSEKEAVSMGYNKE